MSNFNLKAFIKNSGLTNKIVCYVTGYNKNTLTKWCTLDTDEKIPLDFIYKLMASYPDLDYKHYFPTYAKILEMELNDVEQL